MTILPSSSLIFTMVIAMGAELPSISAVSWKDCSGSLTLSLTMSTSKQPSVANGGMSMKTGMLSLS